jgi:hypothetical protein
VLAQHGRTAGRAGRVGQVYLHMDATVDVSSFRHGVRDVVTYQKGYFCTPVEESLIQQILHTARRVRPRPVRQP